MEAEFFSYRLEVVGAEIEHETPKKLVTRSDMDITECRMLLRQLDSVTKKAFNKTTDTLRCQGIEPESVALEFELTAAIIDPVTDHKILQNDWLRFDKFGAAVRLIIDCVTASSDVRELSREVEIALFNLRNFVAEILCKNDVPVPELDPYDNMRSQFNDITRLYLEVVSELTSDDEDVANSVSEELVREVRNFIVLKELLGMCTLFIRDLGLLSPSLSNELRV